MSRDALGGTAWIPREAGTCESAPRTGSTMCPGAGQPRRAPLPEGGLPVRICSQTCPGSGLGLRW